MAQFEIESYEVETLSHATFHFRRITLLSPSLAHGIQHLVWAMFTGASEFPSVFTDEDAVGAATNVGGLNFNGMIFFVWLRSNSFDEVIDILRNEKPVFFQYGLRDLPSNPDNTTKLVVAAGIGTSPEPPGEGAPDPDVLSAQVIDSISSSS